MAMFQFSARQVELNFCDQIKCTVPLTDEVQKKVQDAAKELLRVSQAAKDSDNKEHTLDDLCDSVMDAIDEILGEGMSDQILGMKEGYTILATPLLTARKFATLTIIATKNLRRPLPRKLRFVVTCPMIARPLSATLMAIATTRFASSHLTTKRPVTVTIIRCKKVG